MTLPLQAEAFQGADEKQRLRLWSVGGASAVLPTPLTPYAYADRAMTPSAVPVERRLLSTLESATLYVHRFPNERRMRWSTKRWREAGVKIAEDRTRLVERILVDEPDWFRKHGGNTRPKVMYVDIEQLTDGKAFPKPTDPIISIAWAIDDGHVQCVSRHDGVPWEAAVAAFASAVRHQDPDIIVGFNLESYDLPVLAAHGVTLSRDGSAPKFRTKKRRTSSGDIESQTIELSGRVVYDVRWPAELDMELSGISDRKLKTIAEWLELPHVREDASNTAALTPERLREYNVSDVTLLRTIAKRYLPDKLALAEYIGAPYDDVLNGGSSFAGGVIAARVNAAAGIVSDGSNGTRYAAHIPKGAKFEGATVAIHKTGRFAPCWKADYASLYPSLLVAFGAGPDNTRLVSTHVFNDEEDISQLMPLRLYDSTPESRTYIIVDKVLRRSFEIDVIGRSAFAERISDMMRERLAVKTEAKRTKSAELEARAGMLKIVLNSVYGGMGADHSAHGSKAVAMLVTAGGRAMVEALRSYSWSNAIETDTDGVYFDGEPDGPNPGHLQRQVNTHAEAFGMQPVFSVDVDRYDAAYFYKAKSYGLLDGDDITWHGGAFKGSRHPALFRRVIDEVGGALLRGEPIADLARQARDLTRYAASDFVQRVKWSGNPKSAPGAEVAKSYALKHGREPAIGERLTYVKTPTGYSVPPAELDTAYYQRVVDEALERLGALALAKLKRKGVDL